MPQGAWNKAPAAVKRRYFELIRTGMSGSAAAQRVGVSLSCGSVWFLDAGQVAFIEKPISSRYFSQDDRIEIADGLGRGEPVKEIAARVGKSYQSVYREIARNRKADGSYQPWYAHNQAYLRRRRPKAPRLSTDTALQELVSAKLSARWSPGQVSRWLRRRWPRRRSWHVCAETIYQAVYGKLIAPPSPRYLRTGRVYRHRRGRGRSREGALKQLTAMRSIHQRPVSVDARQQAGHWEGDLIIGKNRSAIATLVDRKTRFTLLVRLPHGHSAQQAGNALIAALTASMTKLPEQLRKTLTWDRGKELSGHAQFALDTGTKVFFADPHSPWQRGTNENTYWCRVIKAGLLRRETLRSGRWVTRRTRAARLSVDVSTVVHRARALTGVT
ncbi:transposase, IS30 family [Saccharomonospora marina XMU15]|uniref:Transposase, IS30 family n=2 Tax=Saccharomonospora TaxID=1851 RepID=H5X623_9PSEU|nr:transposase, IS30 family [Saccharomonospora marina XMU15]